MELLLREREMMRQLEADKALAVRHTQSPSTTPVNSFATPKPRDDLLSNKKRDLARMPSFLSERTENTENLRNVYLDTKTSLLSLSKTDSRLESNGFVSPSMSILSESSFLSIYGQKTGRDSSSPPNLPRSIQSRLEGSGQRSVSMPITDFTQSRSQRSDLLGSREDSKEGIDNRNSTSPLRTFEETETSDSASGHTAPRIALPEKGIERSTTVRPTKPQPLLKVWKEKDRPTSARKIIADEHVASHHGLPPTPDTMSSSMLVQSRNSDDTPLRDQRSEEQRFPILSPGRITLDYTDQVEPSHWRFKPAGVSQPPSVTAFTGRQDVSGATLHENRLPALRRPRSADETTISWHKNDWDSCSEDDLCSEASSFDYWMREGLRPSRGGTNTKSSHHKGFSSQNPPDLFGFPSDAEGWQSNDMFGSLGGNGYLGMGAPLAPAMDAIGSSLPAPEAGLFGSGLASLSRPQPGGAEAAPPPAPYRRSSLHARTSAPGTPMTARAPGFQSKRHEGDGGRKRSVSGHLPSNPNPSGWPMPNTHSSQATVPPVHPHTQQQDKSAEKRHYPPHASQPQATARPRSRGITSLFRRSLGSATGHVQPSASVPASHSPFSPPTTKDAPAPTVGIPAWERRHDMVDDGASATPPPILRNRGPSKSMNVQDGEEQQGTTADSALRAGKGGVAPSSIPGLGAGLNAMLVGQEGGASLTPTAQDNPAQDNNPAQIQGHGRKWFGLGRVTSLRTGGS